MALRDLPALGDGGNVITGFTLSPSLIITAAVVVVVLLGVLVALGWWGWRRLRRSGLVDRAVLQVQAATLPAGPAREITDLRQQLIASLTQTRKVLGALTADASAPEMLADLLRRLERATGSLDSYLRLLQTEPDLAFLRQMMPSLRDRVRTASEDALRLRRVALQWQSEGDRPERELLEVDLRDSVAGLEAGLNEIRHLGSPDQHWPRG